MVSSMVKSIAFLAPGTAGLHTLKPLFLKCSSALGCDLFRLSSISIGIGSQVSNVVLVVHAEEKWTHLFKACYVMVKIICLRCSETMQDISYKIHVHHPKLTGFTQFTMTDIFFEYI